MAFQLIYNPSFPGAICINNGTGTAVPYTQGQLYPIWDLVNGGLTLQNNHYDTQPVFNYTLFGNIGLSIDGGATFAPPASMAALVAWVTQYMYNIGAGGGGSATDVTITGPLGQTIMADSIPVTMADNQTNIPVVIKDPLGQTTMSQSIPVNIASDQSNINVEIAGPLGQAVMADSVPVTIASDQSVLTEGGITVPYISSFLNSTSAYTQYMYLGGVITINNAMRKNNGTGTLSAVTLVDTSNQKQPIDIYIFSQNPSNGVYTDHTSAAPSPADWANVIRKISILSTSYSQAGSGSVGNPIATADMLINEAVFATGGNQNLYAVLVMQGTPTYATSSALTLKFTFYQD